MTAPLRVVTDSGDLAQQIAFKIAQAAGGTVDVGQVVAVSGAGLVTVNIRGVAQSGLPTLAPVAVADNVLVIGKALDRGAVQYVLGPLYPANLPTSGTVASVPTNSYVVPVTTSIGTLSAFFGAAYTPTVGDTVLLTWQGSQPVILFKQGKTGTPSAPPAPKPPPSTPPPPPPKPTYGTSTFQATQSGTWRSGDGWRNDANGNVIQGTAPGYGGANDGAWFYSNQVHSTLAGRTVTAALIWLARTEGGNYGNQTVHLYRISENSRPSGNVSFTATTTTVALDVGDSGWYRLPTSFAQALVDSGGSVGVSAASGPYVRLFGLPNSGYAGALRFSWST